MKKELVALNNTLMELHRNLLFFQKSLVEHEDQRQYNSYELFGLAQNDSRFAWLVPLFKLIVQIDDSSEEALLEDKNIAAIKNKTLLLLENDEEFKKHYQMALAADPSLFALQVAIRKAAGNLPTVKSGMN